MTHLRGAAAVLVLGALAGCSHYTLGPAGDLPFHSLYVEPVLSSAYVAQGQAPVTEMLRQSLLQEDNVKLTDQADADATLEVVLTDYHRDIAATAQNNTLNAQSYDLTLTAKCTLVDNRTGKIYFKERLVTTTLTAYIQGGDSFNESEYQTVTKLARDLGKKIKDAVISTW
jgi:outer membrane lipopolysaccharide assembly protein LptE/RlpB